MFFYVYLLYSKKDGGSYVGFTTDLKERIEKHKQGKVPSTKNRLPVELIHFEAFKDRKSALKKEKYYKTGWGRKYINELIDNYLNSKT